MAVTGDSGSELVAAITAVDGRPRKDSVDCHPSRALVYPNCRHTFLAGKCRFSGLQRTSSPFVSPSGPTHRTSPIASPTWRSPNGNPICAVVRIRAGDEHAGSRHRGCHRRRLELRTEPVGGAPQPRCLAPAGPRCPPHRGAARPHSERWEPTVARGRAISLPRATGRGHRDRGPKLPHTIARVCSSAAAAVDPAHFGSCACVRAARHMRERDDSGEPRHVSGRSVHYLWMG